MDFPDQAFIQEVLYPHSLLHQTPPPPRAIPDPFPLSSPNFSLNPRFTPNSKFRPNPNHRPSPNVTPDPYTNPIYPANPYSNPNFTTNPYTNPSFITNPYANPSFTTNPYANPSFTTNPYTNTSFTPSPYTDPSFTPSPSTDPSFTPNTYPLLRQHCFHRCPYPLRTPNTRFAHLYTHSSTHSRKIRKKSKKNKKLPPVSDIPWPCEDAVVHWDEPWPSFKPPKPAAPAPPLSAEDLAKRAADIAQHDGLKTCQQFFNRDAGSDDEEGDDSDDDDNFVMEDSANSGSEESDESKFFLKVFTDDGELRGYYEKNYEKGEFSCLVCGGMREKVGKRYKDCVALVQHAVTISKTKKRRAHRAYGQVICKVLGWNINRLPTIVLSLEDPLGRALAAVDDSKKIGESANVGNVEAIRSEGTNICGQTVMAEKAGSSLNDDTGKSMDCNIVMEHCDAGKNREDSSEGGDISKVTAEGIGNCLVNGIKLCHI